MIADNDIDTLDPQQLRQALRAAQAQFAVTSELVARHERTVAFKQTVIDKLTHEMAVLKRIKNKDIAAVERIGAVHLILRVACQSTGMGFAALARVTDEALNFASCVGLRVDEGSFHRLGHLHLGRPELAAAPKDLNQVLHRQLRAEGPRVVPEYFQIRAL